MRKLFLISLCLVFATSAVAVEINEIRIDQASTDNDEYIEFAGDPGESLAGLTLLIVGDGGFSSGSLDGLVELGAYSIQSDGILALGEGTFTNTCGSIDGVETLNFENSDNLTFLLVDGYTGDPVHSNVDLDTDDDGVMDYTPWTAIVDEVALVETPTSGDNYFSSVTVGPDGTYVPGHVVKCSGVWLIGDFGLCIDDTPGDPNTVGCAIPNEDMSWGSVKSLY